MQHFKNVFFSEFQEIVDSWYKQSLVFFIPFISFFLIWMIFSKALSTNLPIVVVDEDKTSISREFVFYLDATQTLAVDYEVDTLIQAKKLLQTSKVYGIVVIPAGFAKDVSRHTQAEITAFINAQYILIGKLINATLKSTALAYNIKLQIGSVLVDKKNISKAVAKLLPININITEFYNVNGNYFYFLVLAILPAMWQIMITITSIVAFGEIIKQKKIKSFFSQGIITPLVAKILPYSIIYVIWGIMIVFFIYGFYGWEFHGSFESVVFGIFLCVFAYQIIGLLFLFGGGDYARSLSLAAVYTAPAFAFLGVTFPTISMNNFALFWHKVLPITHFMQLLIQQANYGVINHKTFEHIYALIGFNILFVVLVIVVFLRVKK